MAGIYFIFIGPCFWGGDVVRRMLPYPYTVKRLSKLDPGMKKALPGLLLTFGLACNVPKLINDDTSVLLKTKWW